MNHFSKYTNKKKTAYSSSIAYKNLENKYNLILFYIHFNLAHFARRMRGFKTRFLWLFLLAPLWEMNTKMAFRPSRTHVDVEMNSAHLESRLKTSLDITTFFFFFIFTFIFSRCNFPYEDWFDYFSSYLLIQQ